MSIKTWIRGALFAGALSVGATGAAVGGNVNVASAYTATMTSSWVFTCQFGGWANNDARGQVHINVWYRNCQDQLFNPWKYSPRMVVSVYNLTRPGWGVWSRGTWFEKNRSGDGVVGNVGCPAGDLMMVDAYLNDYMTGAYSTHKVIKIRCGG